MCRAAATGAVDFTRADPRDPNWWRRLNLTLDHVEAESLLAIRMLKHASASRLLAAVNCAALVRPDIGSSILDGFFTEADEQITAIGSLLFPWIEFSATNATKAAIDKMTTQWIATWGDPNDPETQAKIDATVAAMEAASTEAEASWMNS